VANSGGQPGNQNAKKAKRWEGALARALNRAVNGAGVEAGLDKIADTVVGLAMSGDQPAWKEISERFDGKVAQTIAGSDTEPPIRVEAIQLIPMVAGE